MCCSFNRIEAAAALLLEFSEAAPPFKLLLRAGLPFSNTPSSVDKY